MEDFGTVASRIGALADESRRLLYEYVIAQPEPVSRAEAATATGVALPNASFHLDRLAAEGLLEVEYRRLSGRSGPGSGRPSKLYRRAAQQINVSLPPRRYEVLGAILAEAVSRAQHGEPLDDALANTAHERGRSVAASRAEDSPATITDLVEVLRDAGFEATLDRDLVLLANCPFHQLAQAHTELICGLNQAYVKGMAAGLGLNAVDVRLEPDTDHCCVRAHKRAL